MSRQVVDLTLSDSEGEKEQARKRRRLNRLEALDGQDSDVQIQDSGPSDVEIVGPRRNTAVLDDNVDLGDEDLVITNATGQVATRDLAHPRPDCAEHRFTSNTSTSNARYCPQCFCYVCDAKASECRFWGTGARECDHANARHLGYWMRLREAARRGDRALVSAEYYGTGPLGTALLPKQAIRLPYPATGPAQAQRLATGGALCSAAAATGSSAAAAAGQNLDGLRQEFDNPATQLLQTSIPGLRDLVDTLRDSLWGSGQTAAAAVTAISSEANASAGPGPSTVPAPAAPWTGSAPAQAVPQVGQKAQSMKELLPSGTCSLRPMPNPAKDRTAYELGVLHFNVKAVRGLTIAAIAERLERFGFYFNGRNGADEFGDRLALDNLFDTRFGQYGGAYKSKARYLKLLPLPLPPEDSVPLSTQRVRKVLVIDCLGRARATIMGVRVHDKIKRADLLVALQPLLRPLFSPDHELLHVMTADCLSGSFMVLEPDRTMDDAFFDFYSCRDEDEPQIVVFRTGNHPAPTWNANAAVAGSRHSCHPRCTQMPVYAHSGSGGRALMSGNLPAWAVAHVRQFAPPPGPDQSASEGSGPCTRRLACPVLVPIMKQHAKGGREALKEFNVALVRALQPYRAANLGPQPLPVCVLRGNRSKLSLRLPSIPDDTRWDVTRESIGAWHGRSVAQMTAVMAHDLPASSYRIDDLRTTLLDNSASPEAMRETIALVAEAKLRDKALQALKELPMECIAELKRASQQMRPEDRPIRSDCSVSCTVAVDLTLVPTSRAGGDPRLGKAVLKVYTWTSDSPSHSSLFMPWDAWSSLGRSENLNYPLSKTLLILSTGMADPDGPQPTAAARADGAAGTSTSGARPAGVVLQRRIGAERWLALEMYSRLRKLKDAYGGEAVRSVRSINALLEFMQSGEHPAAPQPPGLTVAMRPYQLQSLGFMVDIERMLDVPAAAGASTSADAATAQPEPTDPDAEYGGPGGYRRLFWLPITNSQGQRYWYSPVFQRASPSVPVQPVGGFLAEEMGLGKTVEVMALILANPSPPSVVAGAASPCGRIVSRATLVVCAVSLVGQWQVEAQSKTSGSCRIHPYHGPNRIRDPARLATEFDVVVTTYQTLQSDRTSGKHDPCQAIKWHRIVFDEGHQLKSAAKMARAASELMADRRWLCTGTPISNAVDDLLGQFSAIHMMPLGKKVYFDSYIKMPFAGYGRGGCNGILPLLYALRHTMIRHTKAQNLGGECVLQLPPKTETDVQVLLTAEEQALYLKVQREARRSWETLKALGPAYVNSHLFTATSMLMPLRRICSGGLLQPKDLAMPDAERLAATAGPSSFAAGEGTDAGVPLPDDISECPICVDNLDQPVVTRCNHWFCRECLTGWVQASAHHNCPTCRQPVSIQTLRRGILPQPAAAAAAVGANPEGEACEAVPCESKLRALLEELRAMRQADPQAKALVFTQFSQALEWLKPRLQEEGFGHRTITGDMTQRKRTEAIDSFQHDPYTSVFLLSVRSGAVGINLTAANYVFLLEPCMNPAMEEQAIGRSWRMGQQRPVVVKRLFVKGSVEERIMEVVKARRIASCGGGGGSSAGASGSAAGGIPRDKADLRISELELMFADPQFPPAPEAQ